MSLLLTTVATEVSRQFGSKLSAILGPTRGSAEDARARAIAMYVYRRTAPAEPCYSELGRIFGRDRTTVRHALKKVEGWKKTVKGFSGDVKLVQGRVIERR